MKKAMSIILCAVIAFGFTSGILIPEAYNIALSAEASSQITLPYHYNGLSDNDKNIYLTMRGAILQNRPTVIINKRMTDEQLSVLMEIFDCYDAEAFNLLAVDGVVRNGITTLSLSYTYDKATYDRMMKAVDARARQIISRIPAGISSYDRLIYLHDSIVDNTEFTVDTLNSGNIYGALVEGKAKCDGYSKAFTYLCNRLGILTTTVIGDDIEGGDIGHMWNKVKFNGQWYNIDVTYNDPATALTFNKSYDFFMRCDIWFTATHKEMVSYVSIPPANDDSLNYYRVKRLLAATEAESRTIARNAIIRATRTRTPVVTVKFTTEKVFEDAAESWLEDFFPVLRSVNRNIESNKISERIYFILADPGNLTLTVLFFYPNTRLSYYFTDTSGLTISARNTLERIGIK